MGEKKCPLCKIESASTFSGTFDNFRCDLCRGVYIDSRLVWAPTTLDNWGEILGAVRELHEEYYLPPTVYFNGTVGVKDDRGVDHTIVRLPTSIRERAHTLLTALVKRSKFFGDLVELNDHDYPLAYAKHAEELQQFLSYLEELAYIRPDEHQTLDQGPCYRVTAAGYEAQAGSALLSPLTVFISSTCYDLKDCRAELARHLEELGCHVLASDDPLRFEVSPTEDSIQSCLLNVANADVVLCIVDQRYGAPLPSGEYSGVSATHAEVRHAKKLGKPLYFFIRQEAFTEWAILKRAPETKTKWVETHDDSQRKRWTDFVSECAKLPEEKGISNWCHQFSTVVDLKRIVEMRVCQFRTRIA